MDRTPNASRCGRPARVAAALAGASLLLIATPGPAQAYLDPGTGSMIIQVVIGAVAGALVTARLYWSQIKAKLTGRKPAPDEAGDEPG